MEQPIIPVNLALLQWARNKAGLTQEEVAELAKITPLKARKDSHGYSPAERVKAWEEGNLPITWNQLENLAKVYRRPAITFFLSSPPIEEIKIADFRTVKNRPLQQASPELSAFLRRIDVLHAEVIDLVKAYPHDDLKFIGSVTIDTPVQSVVTSIRHTINFPYEEQRKQRDQSELLRTIRNKIHDLGIFVLFEGDLGSHHSKISPDEFRGIAISHKIAPLIVVNPYDTKAARLFTLMHELAHLWIGDSALSNLDKFGDTNKYNNIEAFCNDIAAEFLVPKALCIDQFAKNTSESINEKIDSLARFFKVSRAVVARRLFDLKCIDGEYYWKYYHFLQSQWNGIKHNIKSADGGPGKNVMDKFRLGEKLISTVIGSAADGLITLQDASRILKVKAARFDSIVK